jgi:hypothetical protein
MSKKRHASNREASCHSHENTMIIDCACSVVSSLCVQIFNRERVFLIVIYMVDLYVMKLFGKRPFCEVSREEKVMSL